MHCDRTGREHRRSRHVFGVITAAIVVATALAGCAQAPPGGSTSVSAASPSSSSSPATPNPTAAASSSATPDPSASTAPVLRSGGTANDNKEYFDLVNNRLFAANGSADGRAIIDNLVAAGFVKKDMQVTPDKDAIGRATDSILFSVKIGDSCLLGQHGGAGYSSVVAPALTSGGACLIGLTRSIDW